MTTHMREKRGPPLNFQSLLGKTKAVKIRFYVELWKVYGIVDCKIGS